jgi:lysophospholipase L1-like esterase
MAYFEQSPTIKGAIVFLGNSITERAEWQELLADSRYPVLNRGIGGDNSFGILARIDEVLRGRPRAIFLMDGINDQFRKLPQEVSVNNYKRIIKRIKRSHQRPLSIFRVHYRSMKNEQKSLIQKVEMCWFRS